MKGPLVPCTSRFEERGRWTVWKAVAEERVDPKTEHVSLMAP